MASKFVSVSTTAPAGSNRVQLRVDNEGAVWIGTDRGFGTTPDAWVRLTPGQWEFLYREVGRRLTKRERAA